MRSLICRITDFGDLNVDFYLLVKLSNLRAKWVFLESPVRRYTMSPMDKFLPVLGTKLFIK